MTFVKDDFNYNRAVINNIRPGAIIYWKGKLAEIIGVSEYPSAHIRILKDQDKPKCKECGTPYESDIHIIMSSPIFQENAKPVPTIDETTVNGEKNPFTKKRPSFDDPPPF